MSALVSSCRGAVDGCAGPIEDRRSPAYRVGPLCLAESLRLVRRIAVLASAVLLVSCHQDEPRSPAIGVERPRVEQAVRDCIGWAKDKDLDRLYRVIAPDAEYLEVSPEGRVTRGIQEFKQGEKFWMSPDFKAVRYDIRDLQISFSHSGDVAWFFCILDDINEWKGKPASWENTRWTGTLEKRDGRWVVVQMHFSFAAK